MSNRTLNRSYLVENATMQPCGMHFPLDILENARA